MIRFLNALDNRLGSAFERIKSATRVNSEQLALYRIVFGLLLLAYFSPSWSWLGDTPPAFFDPYLFSFAYLTDNHLPDVVYRMADIATVLLLLMIILGIRAKLAFFGMFLLSSILLPYYYSFGKIDHHTTLLLFAYLTFGFTNSGAEFALVKDRKVPPAQQDGALAILALCICFGFFSAGLPKLMKWVDFDLNSSGFLFWFYPAYFLEKSQMFLASFVHQIPVWALEVMDYIAVLFEISGFFFLLKGRKAWLFYLTIACIFHLANLLLLNIDFTMNLLTYGFFLLTPAVYLGYLKYKSLLPKIKNPGMLLLISFALLKIGFYAANGSGIVPNYETIAVPLKNYLNLGIWICAIVCGGFLLKNFENPQISVRK